MQEVSDEAFAHAGVMQLQQQRYESQLHALKDRHDAALLELQDAHETAVHASKESLKLKLASMHADMDTQVMQARAQYADQRQVCLSTSC